MWQEEPIQTVIFMAVFSLFIIHYVGPGQKELTLVRVALDGLAGGHDGHPLLHIAACRCR